MFLLCTTFSLVLGLYFLRNNIVLSILISISYLCFVLWRFGRKKFIVFVLFFGIGILIPRIPLPQNNGPEYVGFVTEARDNYIIFESKLQKYYVSSPENEFEIGDKLVIKGEIKKVKFNSFESQFNFQDYLKNKGTQKEIIPKNVEVKRHSLLKIHQFKYSFLSKFDENTATLISAFLFNDKDYSSEVVQLADENNVLFLFSLSGVYLSTLFAISNYLLFLVFSKKTSRILTFLLLLPYAFFSFTKIGTLRVYSLYLLKYLNEFHFKKKFTHIELVSILALIFIAFDYNLVYQEAFYIGFLLSIFAPIILNASKCVKKPLKNLVPLSIFYLILLPIRISGSYLGIFDFAKVYLIIPLNTIFILLTILSLVLPLREGVVGVGKAELWILKKMDAINIRIPFGNWGGAFTFIYLLVFLLLVFYLEAVRIKHFKIAGLVLLAMITISIAPFQEPISNAVYFVNVGQGDSIIIKNKNHTVMIDTGGYKSFDMATETLIPFMNKKKITHIDALILSHDDFDHSGAKDSLISNFKVENVLTEKEDFPYKIGDIELINLNTFESSDSNDSSLVLYTEFMNKKFLFTGDASTNVEENIIKNYNIECDILKVGHHGSSSSTSEKFIKSIKLKEAVISVGAKNYYGHPTNEVIDRLNKYDVKIRRTDLEGTICYFSLFA